MTIYLTNKHHHRDWRQCIYAAEGHSILARFEAILRNIAQYEHTGWYVSFIWFDHSGSNPL